MPKVDFQLEYSDEECCQNCKKWVRINNYKGYCAAHPEEPHEYTYWEEWCKEFESY